MKINIYLSSLLLTLVIKFVTSDLKLPPQQYCGSRLADIMQVACKNRYNTPPPPIGQKRNKMDSEVWDYKDLEDYNAIDYPYQPRQDSMSFMPTRILRSSKRTIIDECCRRPCLISELKSYCAN
uniref:Insulin-like peptide 1 n=1 Tax=Acyrthosiphon pisum TaxID=7029 RepID=A0A5J6XZN6_ACYPI|nr:insulin-like peptide 1 [Acyrthosiphon pisum]